MLKIVAVIGLIVSSSADTLYTLLFSYLVMHVTPVSQKLALYM